MTISSINKFNKNIIDADISWEDGVCAKVTFEHKVDELIAKTILAEISKLPLSCKISEKALLMSLSYVTDPAGHYSLYDSGKKWFIRINRRKRKDEAFENEVITYLLDKGIRVVTPFISGILLRWKDHDYNMSIFPFIDGSHFSGSDRELADLLTEVAKMHSVLKTFKSSKKVFSASLKTAERLNIARGIVADAIKKENFTIFDYPEWAKKNKDWLLELSENFNPYLCLMPLAQCIHGELHLGNVIFPLNNEGAFILDFEETPDAWFPPSFDLAYIVHRFCFYGNPSENLIKRRLNIIENNYGMVPHDLKEMMRQVCWYNIALLIDRSIRNESVSSIGEYDKFLNLDKKTIKYFYI